MYLKKYKVFIIMIFIIVSIFGVSYKWTLNKYGTSVKKDVKKGEVPDRYTIISEVDQILPSTAKVKLILKLKDSGKEYEVKALEVGGLQDDISGKLTVKKVKEYYESSGYKLSSNKDNLLVFIKESAYEPEMYYLGVTNDEYVAIFKCDNEGNMTIEDPVDDISKRKVEEFPKNDQKSLNNFEFKFNSKEEAQEELNLITS